MENVHSFEQRSLSSSRDELGCKNRVFLVDRHDPDGEWSAANQAQLKKVSDDLCGADYGPFCTNQWRTSKYTLFDFLPRNLFEQFRRLANLYFLVTAIIQIVLPYSPIGPSTSLIPLIFVVSTTAIKQAYEDFLRHKLDKKINNRMCYILRGKCLVEIRSKDIKVGDFVYVKNNEEIPCDMILLAASGSGDRCYITTANLDGETSLKCRSCFNIRSQIGSINVLDDSLLFFEYDRPNATLYEFNGVLRAPKDDVAYQRLVNYREPSSRSRSFSSRLSSSIDNSPLSSIHKLIKRKNNFHEIPLDITNLLLRASRLRNTNFIYGVAVYTGADTKLAHNSQVKPNKFSSIESKVNLFLFLAFTLVMFGSLIATLMYKRFDFWYLQGIMTSDSFGQILLSHFLIYNYLIPISLYVTLEFVKFFGTVAVVNDKSMQVVATKSVSSVDTVEGPRCNSSDLNEDLGQVQVLFSDKTGTLTENKMRFIACSVDGKLFRCIEETLYLVPRDIGGVLNIPQVVRKIATITSNRYAFISPTANISYKSRDHFDHRIVPPINRLTEVSNLNETVEKIVDFFVCLCLCSTITLNDGLPINDCLPDKLKEYDYKSASPDEGSLITAAASFGVTLIKSSESECYFALDRRLLRKYDIPKAGQAKYSAVVETTNSTDKFVVRHFERVASFEFNSVRKRMSVIYKDLDNDCLILVAKGSESLLDCVRMSPLSPEEERTMNFNLAYFEAFAKSGLRTMLAARRGLSLEEFEAIQSAVKEARLSQQNRIKLLNSVYKRAESNLTLIGTTAVEDSLQEGVPQTISNLRWAGIKVWLLTGDKVETAISVAHLCRLLDRGTTLFNLVRQRDAKSCIAALASFETQLNGSESATLAADNNQSGQEQSSISYDNQNCALVVDGRSLYYALKYAKREFSVVSKQCVCVLGCRLSPLQKAEIVTLVKSFEESPITAAIGDGANDVSMIQESHVGIGIIGREGRQAVNSSDFAISRFHMLNKLFFVHGHLFYHRTANLIHYFFYKNMLFILPQFIYSFYSLSSGSSIYHPAELICYNLVYTSLPIIVYGLYEIHIPEAHLEMHPALYKMNQGNDQLKLGAFLCWLLLATIQASIAFYWFYFNWGSYDSFFQAGKVVGSGGFARVLFTSIIFIGLVKLYVLSRRHSWLLLAAILVSIASLLSTYIFCGLFDWCKYIGDTTFYGRSMDLIVSPMFWVAVVSTTAVAMFPDLIWSLKERISASYKARRLIVSSLETAQDTRLYD